MIILTSAYVAGSSIDSDFPRIGWQSHLRDLELDATAITVSSEDEEGPRDAPLRPSTEEFWMPTSLPATWQFELGSARDVNYFGLLGYNLDGIQILVETTDGSVAGSPSARTFETFASDLIAGDDSPIMLLDASRSIVAGRVTFSAASTPSEMPKLVSLYAGEVLECYRGCYGGVSPMNMNRNTVLYGGWSQTGQLLHQAFRSHGQRGSLALQNLPPSWVRSEFDPFILHARSMPFFFAWRPSTYPLEVAYARATSDIVPSNMSKTRGFMAVSFSMVGLGKED